MQVWVETRVSVLLSPSVLHNYDVFLSFSNLYETKSVNIAFSVANYLDKCQAPLGRLNLVINLVVIKKEGQ